MKKISRVLAMVFALALAFSACVSASARAKVDGKYTTLTNAPQLCAYLFKNYDQAKSGSISITQGTLFYSNDNYNEDYLLGGQHMPYRQYTDRLSGSEDLDNPEIPVYLVCIAGTEVIGGHANNTDADLMTGFNLPNQYEREIKRIIEENIPKGSNLMVCGIPNGVHQLKLDKSTCQRFVTDSNSNSTANFIYNGNLNMNEVKWDAIDSAEKVAQKLG